MSIVISHRAKALKPSPTLAVSGEAKRMIKDGIDVINFGVGEPDFPTPSAIKRAGKKAIDANFTKYTATAGIIELREAIADKLKRDNDLICDPNDILVSPGAKAAIINVLMATCDPRDDVIIPSPYWVSYTSQVEMIDANPHLLQTKMSSDFRINTKELEEMIKNLSNPKVLILNSPNNPTGTVYTKKSLEKISEICLRYNILVIADEIYEKLIYDGEKHISIASLSPEIRENTVLINGVSKAYAMTGWRLGYAAGPKELIKRATRIQSHTTSSVNSIAQIAAITALLEETNDVEKMREKFRKRRNYLIENLNAIDHVKCNKPKGAFYAMPNVKYYIHNNTKGITNSVQLCEYLLKEFKIALVPGSAFGANNFVRFSYAVSMDDIKKGIARFRAGLESLTI